MAGWDIEPIQKGGSVSKLQFEAAALKYMRRGRIKKDP
jgi:hypothetical protein